VECENLKPDLLHGKTTLVITYFNPEAPTGGSSALMRNFLRNFNSQSFEIICTAPRKAVEERLFKVHTTLTDIYSWRRLVQRLVWKLILNRDVSRVQKLIDSINPDCIFLVYPHRYNTEVFLSLKVHATTKIIAYFHDTFVEGQLNTRRETSLVRQHLLLLDRIDTLFVMNDGMEKLYRHKYQTPAIALEHCYPEYHDSIDAQQLEDQHIESTLFWGGNVVGYNSKSLTRIMELGERFGLDFEVASGQAKENISKLIAGRPFIKTHYERNAYLSAIQKKQLLVISLDWPDETDYHYDEISTIFSTKTIEYLMSGRPIILHCPKEYFMAQFFIKNRCGYVLTNRNPNQLDEIFADMLQMNHSLTLRNARRTALKFSPAVVISKYQNALRTAIL